MLADLRTGKISCISKNIGQSGQLPSELCALGIFPYVPTIPIKYNGKILFGT